MTAPCKCCIETPSEHERYNAPDSAQKITKKATRIRVAFYRLRRLQIGWQCRHNFFCAVRLEDIRRFDNAIGLAHIVYVASDKDHRQIGVNGS